MAVVALIRTEVTVASYIFPTKAQEHSRIATAEPTDFLSWAHRYLDRKDS